MYVLFSLIICDCTYITCIYVRFITWVHFCLLFVCLFVSMIFNEGAYLTSRQSYIRPSKMVLLLPFILKHCYMYAKWLRLTCVYAFVNQYDNQSTNFEISLFVVVVFVVFLCVFSVRLLSVLRGHYVFFIPATTANDLRLRRIFYPRFYPLHLFFPILILEKEPVFSLLNVQC